MSEHHVGTPCWFQVAEQQRKEAVQAALLAMTHAMNDIAHLSPGEVERLVEQQALDLNLSMLDNRCQHPFVPETYHARCMEHALAVTC